MCTCLTLSQVVQESWKKCTRCPGLVLGFVPLKEMIKLGEALHGRSLQKTGLGSGKGPTFQNQYLKS